LENLVMTQCVARWLDYSWADIGLGVDSILNIKESQGCFLAVKALYCLQVPIVYNFNAKHQ